ncbi:hypothetical protein PsorP6_015258 [Peronosclerospora sorghi]|uniref:Uncharacterized protein n=1 Tax=Peronosclerospora sorghi TaxID=230839 RepID=A0ACC0VS78_9STRA|nr:hypothetical protein PsorP6_015258 [Peronosclerospora sorghi]
MTTSIVPLLALSLGTSWLVLVATARLSVTVTHVPLVPLTFLSLVPVLVSLAIVGDGVRARLFAQWWTKTFVSPRAAAPSPAQALAAARVELGKALTDPWPSPRRVPRPPPAERVVSSGRSLYDQVHGRMHDHVFRPDALVYFMDSATGAFVQATTHRKLVLTPSPTATAYCLFHVDKGKPQHWGLRVAATQRYVGQNLVQKMVVTSRKLQAWESFRVVQRPDDARGHGACSPEIYLILSAARFGKGLWVARAPSSSARTMQNRSASLDTEDDAASDDERPRRARGVFLSKHFEHAIPFVYSSDLSALVAARRQHATAASEASRPVLTRAQTAPHLMGSVLHVKGATFQVPKLSRASSGTDATRPPWRDTNAETPAFLETPDDDMIELLTTTIPGSSVETFLEMVAPRAARLKRTKEPSGSDEPQRRDDLLGDWHVHPRYGLVRTLSYRTDANALFQFPALDRAKSNSRARDNVKAVTVEQFYSCVVHRDPRDDKDESPPHQAELRVKIYTLSIPYSNCFSAEVLVEAEDVVAGEEEDGKPSPTSPVVLRLRWRAGVVFTRETMLKDQMERAALDALRRSCSSLVEVLQGKKQSKRESLLSQLSRGTSSSTERASTDPLASSGSVPGSFRPDARSKPREKLQLAALPRAFALDYVEGLISAISDSNALFVHFSNLPMQLPWRAGRVKEPRADAAVATTAYSFFTSAPEGFTQVLEENMGGKVTASLFFEALLSDASALFRRVRADTGNKEVDICAWRGIVSTDRSRARTKGFIRKQVLQMPVHGVPGVDVVQVEDFEYYSLIPRRDDDALEPTGAAHGSTPCRKKTRGSVSDSVGDGQDATGEQRAPSQACKAQRLEFGMKLFVPALPEGSHFSIEVLVLVEPATNEALDHVLRILFAVPARHHHVEARGHAVVNPHVVAGVLRGLKQIWKHVAQTMVALCDTTNDHVMIPPDHAKPLSRTEDERQLLHLARAHPKLPTHDELASRLIDSIAAVYSCVDL